MREHGYRLVRTIILELTCTKQSKRQPTAWRLPIGGLGKGWNHGLLCSAFTFYKRPFPWLESVTVWSMAAILPVAPRLTFAPSVVNFKISYMWLFLVDESWFVGGLCYLFPNKGTHLSENEKKYLYIFLFFVCLLFFIKQN